MIHVGARDWSPGERQALVSDGVHVIDLRGLDDLAEALDRVDAARILVHVDLDVIDVKFGRANHYAAGGGLAPDDVLRAIEAAARRFPIAGLVLASYDPGGDAEGTIAGAAQAIVAGALRTRAPRY